MLSMFETKHTDASDSSGVEFFIARARLVNRITTLTRREEFDPKQHNDTAGIFLWFLSLMVEID